MERKVESEAVLEHIKLDEFDTSLSIYRLLHPGQIKLMQQSMERVGQLQPVITRRNGDRYQLIDGFKRYVYQMIMQREKPNNAINQYIISKSKVFLFT